MHRMPESNPLAPLQALSPPLESSPLAVALQRIPRRFQVIRQGAPTGPWLNTVCLFPCCTHLLPAAYDIPVTGGISRRCISQLTIGSHTIYLS